MISTFANLFKRRLPEQQPTWLILLGILSVTVYAFSRTGFPEIARIGSTIATLTGLWGLFKYGKIVNSHILLRFIWIAVIIQLISWGLSQYVTPEWANSLAGLFLFRSLGGLHSIKVLYGWFGGLQQWVY